MKILLIDVGSTFIKYAVWDGGNVIVEGKNAFPDAVISGEFEYEVPSKIIAASIFEIFDIAMQYGIKGCYMGVQMHGFVLRYADGSFGNYVSWRDKLARLPELERYAHIDLAKNGTSAKANLPLFKLLCGRGYGACEFFTLGSYLAFMLTGNNSTHKTDACASGLFDADTLVGTSMLGDLAMPRVTRDVTIVGEYRGVSIYAPVGDHQASFKGSGAERQAYLLNVGTATQISTVGKYDELQDGVEARPYFDKNRLLTVTGLVGGAKLFEGGDVDGLLCEVERALDKLPRRDKMYVGGGGADLILEGLEKRMAARGIACLKIDRQIGIEGLYMLSKKQKIGVMISEVCFANMPVILKNQALDFMIVDCEHGAFDYSAVSGMMMTARLSGLDAVVRLPDNLRRDVTRFCDMGAGGLLLPMTNCAGDIMEVVKYAKYAPLGKRGISTNRAHTLYDPPPIDEYTVQANERVKVYAQIETRAGVDNVDEILSVDGVEGVIIGPNDLSCDLGCIGNIEPITEAIDKVATSAASHGKVWGIITTSKSLIDHSLSRGVDMISYGSEINMIKDYCKSIRGKIYG